MDKNKSRRGEMTPADLRAARKLRVIWERQRIPLGLTQASAGASLGDIGQSAVSQYLNGKIPLGVEITLKWAALLQVDPAEIRGDVAELLADKTGKTVGQFGLDGRQVGTDVPVIEFATLAGATFGEDFDPAKMARSRTICPVNHGSRTFAFRVNDDSMASTTSKSIPAGYFVWVDPDQVQVAHDRPVLARLANGQHVLAQYMEQAGRRWLHLQNPAYPAITDPFEIVGRVIFKGEET